MRDVVGTRVEVSYFVLGTRLFGNEFERYLALAASAANNIDIFVIKENFTEVWNRYVELGKSACDDS